MDPPPVPDWARNHDRPTSPIVDTYTDDELRIMLDEAYVRPYVAGLLVEQRDTAGAKWRITQELEL